MLPHIAVGPWEVSTYSLAYVVAIVVAGLFAQRRVQTMGVSWRLSLELVAVTIVVAGLGARLMYLLFRLLPATTGGHPISTGWGQSVLGAVVGGGIAGLGLCRWRGVAPWHAADRIIPALPLGLAVGRLGCLGAGCCSGRPTDSWMGFYLPDQAGLWCSRFPTQVLSSLANLMIVLTLLGVERQVTKRAEPDLWSPGAGYLTALFVVLFSVKRFALEFLRMGQPAVLGVFNWPQMLLGVAAILAVAVWWLALRRRPAH